MGQILMQIQTCESGKNDVNAGGSLGETKKNVLRCHIMNLKDNIQSFAIGIAAAELTVKTYFKY